MNSFGPLLRLRFQEVLRTWRIWVLPCTMLFLALASATLAKFTNVLISSALAGQGMPIYLPDPTFSDSYLQWIKNLTQIALLVIVVIAAGTINSEVRSGAAVTILVKPASRTAYVLTHAVALITVVTASAFLGVGAAWVATQFFFGAASILPILASTAVWLVLAYLLISVAVLASVTIDPVSGAAGIGIAGFFVLAVLGVFPPLATYTPAGLMPVSSALAAHTQAMDHTLWWPIATGLLLTIAFFMIAVAAFTRREL